MSISLSSKISLILTGLLFTVFAYPAAAVNTAPATNRRPFPVNTIATGSTNRTSALEKAEIKEEIIRNKLARMQEERATKAATLRAKLETFKDKKKATTAARININLNKLNQNQTEQMWRYLNNVTVVLDKLEARLKQANADIKNPAAAKEAIVIARQAIASASAAVTAQRDKDYTIIITTELRIKEAAKNQRDKLHTDLSAVRKMVINARQTVAQAIRTAKANVIPAETKEGTVSGQQ